METYRVEYFDRYGHRKSRVFLTESRRAQFLVSLHATDVIRLAVVADPVMAAAPSIPVTHSSPRYPVLPSGDCYRWPTKCIWVNDIRREHPTIKTTDCDMCGEHICTADGEWPLPEEEVGEFWIPADNNSVYGHASCGLERGLELA